MLTLPRGRRVLALDALVVVWVSAWILIGLAVAEAVADLTKLTQTFRSVGGAVVEVGGALDGLDVPFLGGPIDRTSRAITEAGRDIVARGSAAREEIEQASALLGAAVAVTPSVTVVFVYLSARTDRVREAFALRAFLGENRHDERLESLLAVRGLQQAPYRRLRRIASWPWELDAPKTRHALAEEELRRLGVDRRALRTTPPGQRPTP